MNDIIVYVLTDKNGDIARYSNIPGTGMSVIQDNPIIDMSKLFGYKIVIGDGNKKHLVFEKISCGAGYVRKYDYKAEMKNNMLLLHEHDYSANVNERKHVIYKFLIKE